MWDVFAKLRAKTNFRSHPWQEVGRRCDWLRQSQTHREVCQGLVVFVLAILLVRGAVEKIVEIVGRCHFDLQNPARTECVVR